MDNNNQNAQPVSQWPPMKVGQWFGTMLLMCIPLVNFILMFVWAFGSNVNPSKKTFFRASLLLAVIVAGLGLVFGVIAAVLGVPLSFNFNL